MEQTAEPTQAERMDGFRTLRIIDELLGAVIVILMITWIINWRGGFAWTSDITLQFNWHPLLMTIGLVYLYARAILIYRTQRNLRKRRLKLIHGGLMVFIIICVIIAQVAVFEYHNFSDPPKPNLYTLHSWIGLTTVILFCCQWVAGCVSFFYPGVQPHLRASYLPIHAYFGCAGFVGAIAACLTGFNEKAIWTLQNSYSEFVPEGLFINSMGFLLILFGGVTIYLVSQERYRRLPMPEDEILLTGRAG